jgi:hypothetical protein
MPSSDATTVQDQMFWWAQICEVAATTPLYRREVATSRSVVRTALPDASASHR